MNKESENKLRVGISIGDLNGIGMEIIIKTFLDNRMLEICTPIIYGSSKVASFHKKLIHTGEFSFNIIKEAAQAVNKKVNLVNCWDEEVKIDIGLPTEISGKYAFKSLEAATNDLASNKIDVLVTAPINKNTIHSAKFPFKGHTEYLAGIAGTESYLMILTSENPAGGKGLKIGTVTGHIALKEVAGSITIEKILDKLRVFNRSLVQDFGISKPKIAILGLNPHAGDKGLIGTEEQQIIIPAIEKGKAEKILAFGPYSADAFFGTSAYISFDGILAMYHDQGLIPFKTLFFNEGVNYTAGLPIVRTSPDHGVGYDIAGKNMASETSFRNAVYLACDIYLRRKEYKRTYANPLKLTSVSKEGV